MHKLKVKKLTSTAKLPQKAHVTDAGFDIFADEDVVLTNNNTTVVSTGLSIEIPDGYYGELKGRSGLTVKTLFRVHTGTIDSDYRGELGVMCYQSYSDDSKAIKRSYTIHKGDKIAQLIILPLPEFEVEEVDELSNTERGEGGFGSTGTK